MVNNRVQLFNSEGKYLHAVNNNLKEIFRPTSVAFTRCSNLIVIASWRIICFNETGNLVKKITNKHLKNPNRLTIASDGRMMVCDWGDDTLKVLCPDGKQLLLTISDSDHGRPRFAVCHQDIFVVSYSKQESVKVFNKDGVYLHSIDTPGSGDGQMRNPAGLAVESFSNLVVCDGRNSKLQIFTFDGNQVSIIEGQHIGLEFPDSVAVSTTRQLYITDRERCCVLVFH